MSNLEQSASFWDREHSVSEFRSWMEHPLIRNAINMRIGENGPSWPIDWFAGWIGERTFDRALSLGCGTGALERDLLRRGICGSIDAVDLSVPSVVTATRLAAEEHLSSGVRYFVADFNRLTLAHGRYDLVMFNQSLHHVWALEELLSTVLDALVTDGVLFLDEYVGPSRTWWTPSRFSSVRFVYDRLPAPVRTEKKLPLPVHAFDPSEAIRSGQILPRVAIGFEVTASRPYGGNLIAPIFPALRNPVEDEIIAGLVEEEDALLAEHGGSHYRIIVAQPRRGPSRIVAQLIYRLLAVVHSLGLAALALTIRRFARRVWIAVDRRVRRRPIEDYT